MVKRNITITLEKAIEWYNSDDESLKDLALQAWRIDYDTKTDMEG